MAAPCVAASWMFGGDCRLFSVWKGMNIQDDGLEGDMPLYCPDIVYLDHCPFAPKFGVHHCIREATESVENSRCSVATKGALYSLSLG